MSQNLFVILILATLTICFNILLALLLFLTPKIKKNVHPGIVTLIFFPTALILFGSFVIFDLLPSPTYLIIAIIAAVFLSLGFLLNSLLAFVALKLRRKIITRNDITVSMSGIALSYYLLLPLIYTFCQIFCIPFKMSTFLTIFLTVLMQSILWIMWFGIRDLILIISLVAASCIPFLLAYHYPAWLHMTD